MAMSFAPCIRARIRPCLKTILILLAVSVLISSSSIVGRAQSTPTATPSASPIVGTVLQNSNLRQGPGTTYAIVGSAQAGQVVVIVGTNTAGDWYHLDTGAWIAVFLVKVTATSQPLSEQAYANELAQLVANYSSAFERLTTETKALGQNNSLFLDNGWRLRVGGALALMKKTGEEIRTLVPPVHFVEMHNDVLVAAHHYDQAVDFIVDGLDQRDANLIAAAGDEIVLGNDALNRAKAKAEILTQATPSPPLNASETLTATPARGLLPTPTPTANTVALFPTATATGGSASPRANRVANLRGGPGTTYPIVGSVQPDQILAIVSQNEAGDWYQLADGVWIAAFLVNNAPVSSVLPVAETIPPTSTSVPAATPGAAVQSEEPSPTSSSIVNIGQEIQGKGWRFKVSAIHKRKVVYFYSNSYVAMGHFLVVIIDAVNEQSGTDYFDRQIEPYLTDDPGNVYLQSIAGSSYAAWQYEGLATIYTDVNPGNFVRIAAAFDLPDNVGHVLLSTDLPAWVDLGDFASMASEDE